ncbi:MAG: hypothetical protein MJK12_20065 [Colwellia sp.]|nr:hypothetical protein [Colwellia sp.]
MSAQLRKRITKIVSYFILIYSLLFFALAPLRMLAVESQSHIAMKVVGYSHQYLFWSWIHLLDEENIIRKIAYKNDVYWCEKSDMCSVSKT